MNLATIPPTGNPLTDLFGNILFGGIGAGPPRKGSYEVITGPKFTPGGAPIPFASYESTTVKYGSGRNAFSTGATRITPSPFYKTQNIEDAAKTYYQNEPGGQVQSYAPGARKIWEDISQGFLPDLGAGAFMGQNQSNAPGIPQWLPLAGLAVLAVVLLQRRR